MPVLTVRLEEDPPSKANSYSVIRLPVTDPKTGQVVLRSRLKKSSKTLAFEEHLAWLVGERMRQTGFAPIEGDAVLQIDWYRADRRRRDVDNIVKAIQDALTLAGVWQDDSQVATLIVNRFWGQDTTEPHLAITVGPRQPGLVAILTTLWERAVRFLHPTHYSRRHWVKQEEAEQVFGPPKVPVLKTFCRQCELGIGVNAHETEIWLEPLPQPSGELRFEVVCGWCARDDELPAHYRVFSTEEVAELSWPAMFNIIEARREELSHELARSA